MVLGVLNTFKGFGCIHEVRPVEPAVCTGIRKRDEARVLLGLPARCSLKNTALCKSEVTWGKSQRISSATLDISYNYSVLKGKLKEKQCLLSLNLAMTSICLYTRVNALMC